MRAIRRTIASGTVAAVVLGLGVGIGTVSASSAAVPSLTEIGAPFATASFNGWVLDSGATGEVWSSPAIADVTGDGQPEIIVGGLNSVVRVYRADSSRALVATIDPGGGNQATRNGATQASPAIGDMNGDGVDDIVIANTGGILSAYSLKGGAPSQIFRRYIAPAFVGALEGIFSTPALGYIDGDARLDTVTSTWGQTLDAWSGPSATKIDSANQWLKDTIWSSPVIGDVDGDGENEIVVGADCEGSGLPQPCYPNGGGYVWVFNLNGSLQWSYFVNRAVVWSTPALADLNGDGVLDVVVGTGLYFNGPEARKVIALNVRNKTRLWEATTARAVLGSPSVGDVDGDGKPEVFVVGRGGLMYSFQGEDGAVRGSVCVMDGGCDGSDTASHGGVALADIDGDGVIEAITQAEQQLRVFNANTMQPEASLRSAYNRTIFAGSSTPTVASVGGKTWIAIASRGDGQSNNSQRDEFDELVIQVWQSNSALGAAPWPTFKQNNYRTGNAVAAAAPNPLATENFVNRLYLDFLGRPASASELSNGTSRLMNRQIDRYGLATELSRSDEWISTVISGFYRDTLNREPDPAGLRGWIAAARGGMPVAQIASAFYSSPEYFSTVGQNDYKTWVEDLYVKLLKRSGDAGGVNGWVTALRAGMPRDTLSFGFYQSAETVMVRITVLYDRLLNRAPEPGGVANWAPFVLNEGDLVLAAALAASQEYYNNAQN